MKQAKPTVPSLSPYYYSSHWSHVFTLVVSYLCVNVTFIKMCEPVIGQVFSVHSGSGKLV